MSMLARWVPGDILVAVADGGVLALNGSAQAVEAMWAELGEHRRLGDLLRSLSRLHDNEVFTLPDFLMMAIEGQELRVAGRGRFSLHLDTVDGERSFSASEVVVWEESRYDRVSQCILELAPDAGGSAGPEQLEELLPLRSGIVRASQLHIGFGSHPTPLSPPAPSSALRGEEAQLPSAVQEVIQQAQTEDVLEQVAPPVALRPATQGQEEAVYPDSPDPGRTLGPESLDLLAGADSPQGTGSEDPATVLVGPDDVPAAKAADPQIREQQAEDEYFGHLFEHTMMRGVEAAAIRSVHSEDVDPLAQVTGGLGRHRAVPQGEDTSSHPLEAYSAQADNQLPAHGRAPHVGGADEASPNGSTPSGEHWRHDGCTVSAAGLHAARDALGGQATMTGTGPDDLSGTSTSVLAVFCEAGHPNPVHASSCRECDGAITSRTGQVQRPVLGILRVSSGATAVLDADVIIGRVPQGTSSTSAQSPRLLAVPSPGKAISKTHCAVRVEGWDMSVEDLGSTNGTFLLRAGEEPRRVPEHQPLFLRIGDVIDIGDDTTLTVEREA